MSKNIFLLIGMPGCGKTTIGKAISDKLKLKFYDMDEYIEEMTNSKISDLFLHGEEYFRDYETKACKELSDIKENVVISSGGGIIKRKENIDFFKENGIIIFIDRPVENIIKDIDSSSRPLLKEGKSKLYNLYLERYNLYNEYCNYKIINDNSLKFVIDNIIDLIDTLNRKNELKSPLSIEA